MGVIRIRHTRSNTLSPHAVLNPKLSRASRGLLWELCSSSHVSMRILAESSPDDEVLLQGAKRELEEHGYLRVDDDGWIVTDDPDSAPLPMAVAP